MNRPRASGGPWPGSVVLSQGWARAHARPLEDQSMEAALRLERGGSGFLARCSHWLFDAGAPAVNSPPLPDRESDTWITAGFVPHADLALLEKALSSPLPEPTVPIRTGKVSDWARAAELDQQAFSPGWRLGVIGLADAASATPRSKFLVAGGAQIDGFAIAGISQRVSYLQRLAVVPEKRSQGLGRSLVRSAALWARSRGARTMLLNTQPDNLRAIELYESEGFHISTERLRLLRATR